MIESRQFTLPNGLRVIHHRDESTAMVTLNTLYNTGSRDESPSTAGIAHLFEHLMFGGSKHIADYSAEIQYAGGSDNAWTSQDFTNFYVTLPAVNIETALRAESDRLLSPRLDSATITTQKKVVTEEFKESLNRPYGDLYHKLLGNLYDPGHPYSHPVIGTVPELISEFPEEEICRWFQNHYTPSNAILAIDGNITFDHTRELVEKWYGDIPARVAAERNLPSKVFNDDRGKLNVSGRAGSTLIMVAYPMQGYGTAQYFAADLLSDILSEGRAARFTQNIEEVPGSTIARAEACISGFEGPGYFLLTALMADESPQPVADAPRRLIDEACRLTLNGNITAEEIERVLNRHESRRSISMMNARDRSFALATSVFHNDDINAEIPRLRAFSASELRSHAADIFAAKPTVLTYSPQ